MRKISRFFYIRKKPCPASMNKDFVQNKCRMCGKILCCLKCRFRHEETVHGINVECDICIYGKMMIVTEASSLLLQHLKRDHWPLHCVHCKTVILTIDDLLFADHKCPVMAVNNCTSPKIIDDNAQLSSSPLILTPFFEKFVSEKTDVGVTATTMIRMALTSTPNPRVFPSPPITSPNGYLEMKTVYKSTLKLSASSGTPNNSKKGERRVTFLETPILTVQNKKQKPLIILQKSAEEVETSVESFHSANFNGNEELTEQSRELWESARTNQENTPTSDSPPPTGDNLWSSMRKMVRSVMNNISLNNDESNKKRSQPDDFEDDDDDEPSNRFKRMKYSTIKCRRSIRQLEPLQQIRLMGRPICHDKSTQTEDDLFV